jgi:c-di-GMP-binding flagellar brake protein YcgR
MQNRRAHLRHSVEVTAEIEIDGHFVSGTTRDVSTGGAKVVLDGEIAEGRAVAVALILTEDGIEAADKEPFEIEATVMWAAPTDEGGAMAGLRFAELGAEQCARLDRFLSNISE